MDRYRIAPGAEVDLAARATDDRSLFAGTKKEGRRRTEEQVARIEELQELMWADGSKRLLIVLQATDTGGKDGTIRKVLDGVNPQGVRVASFKKPTEPELARDYLWRVHPHVPADGEIVVFNRSHYEDVLVVRVHELVPEERWRRRYEHIRAFEQLLVDEGTTILKFFLHLGFDEQRERLQARLDDPTKHWKFDRGDLRERGHWDAYQAAFAEAIAETSTEAAPWYVIPADRKWYRNLVISRIVVDTLEGLGMSYPASDDLTDVVIP